MPNRQFHTAISEPRYNRYLTSCGNKQRALKLYRANINLSRELYGVLGIFEVVLRNSIDRHMSATFGPFWLEDAVAPGGFFDINPGCQDTFHKVHEAIAELGSSYTHDRLIAKLTFGFWRYQFGSKEFAASGSTLLNIFPNRPPKTRQKDIFKDLFRVNDLRNRIAHHEPICFLNNTISVDRTKKAYLVILNQLYWMGCNQNRMLYGIDNVPKALLCIENMQTYSSVLS